MLWKLNWSWGFILSSKGKVDFHLIWIWSSQGSLLSCSRTLRLENCKTVVQKKYWPQDTVTHHLLWSKWYYLKIFLSKSHIIRQIKFLTFWGWSRVLVLTHFKTRVVKIIVDNVNNNSLQCRQSAAACCCIAASPQWVHSASIIHVCSFHKTLNCYSSVAGFTA